MSHNLIAVRQTDEPPFKSIRLYMASLMEIYTPCYCCRTQTPQRATCARQRPGMQRGYQIKPAEYSHSQLQIDGQPTVQRHPVPPSYPPPRLPLRHVYSVGTLYRVVFIYSRARCADFSNTLLTDKRAPSLACSSPCGSALPPPAPARCACHTHVCKRLKNYVFSISFDKNQHHLWSAQLGGIPIW